MDYDPKKIALIERAEARMGEIAFLTSAKAPEFMSIMNTATAYAQECRKIAAHKEATLEARNKALRGQLMLERVPEILRERGLATTKNPLGSAELRDSIIDSDKDWLAAVDALIYANSEKTEWSVREQALGRAFSAAKAIVGERQWTPNTSAGHEGNNRNPEMKKWDPKLDNQADTVDTFFGR